MQTHWVIEKILNSLTDWSLVVGGCLLSLSEIGFKEVHGVAPKKLLAICFSCYCSKLLSKVQRGGYSPAIHENMN